eukprot:6004844-Prymnesium_polylepis.1
MLRNVSLERWLTFRPIISINCVSSSNTETGQEPGRRARPSPRARPPDGMSFSSSRSSTSGFVGVAAAALPPPAAARVVGRD